MTHAFIRERIGAGKPQFTLIDSGADQTPDACVKGLFFRLALAPFIQAAFRLGKKDFRA